MTFTNNYQAFLALVRAGLWERDVELQKYGSTDFSEIMRLAEEQLVVGLVTAGLEQVKDVKVSQSWTLQFIGSTLQIEQRNKAMNQLVARLVKILRIVEVYTLLVKGQGVAQCYERPLWRASGDVDFYLSKNNYERAKACLIPLALRVEPEDTRRLHFGMTIEDFIVELHGTMYTGLSRKMNLVSDEVHQDIFYCGNVRSWNNEGVQVFLPSADNDLIIIFNHFINHFYGEGIGLRQVCDWCRLLWKYRDSLNYGLLEHRIRKENLMTEWRAFAAFAVEYLGMPSEAMPFYENELSWHRKAEKICKLVLETGNFGHNKDESYRRNYSGLAGNFITAWKRFKEFARIAMIFPCNAPKFYVTYLINRFRAVA